MSPLSTLLLLLVASCSAFQMAPMQAPRSACAVSSTRVTNEVGMMASRVAPKKKVLKKVVKKPVKKPVKKVVAKRPVAKKVVKKAAPKPASRKVVKRTATAVRKPVAKKVVRKAVPKRSEQRTSGPTTSFFSSGQLFARRGASLGLQERFGFKMSKTAQKTNVPSYRKPLNIIK